MNDEIIIPTKKEIDKIAGIFLRGNAGCGITIKADRNGFSEEIKKNFSLYDVIEIAIGNWEGKRSAFTRKK